MTGEKTGLGVPVTASPRPLSVVGGEGKGEAVVVTTPSTLNGPCCRFSCPNWAGALVGPGVAKSGGVTKEVEGVEKKIPEFPFSSLTLGRSPASVSFPGLWKGCRVGEPKSKTAKSAGSLNPSSSVLVKGLFCCSITDLVVVLLVVLLVGLRVVDGLCGAEVEGKNSCGLLGGVPAGLGGLLMLLSSCCWPKGVTTMEFGRSVELGKLFGL